MPDSHSSKNPNGFRVVHSDYDELETISSSADMSLSEPTDAELSAIEAGTDDYTSEYSPIAGRIGNPLAAAGEPMRVAVGAAEVFELLQDALSTNRAWLKDFQDDTIEIPQDMYEILVAYRKFVYRKVA